MMFGFSAPETKESQQTPPTTASASTAPPSTTYVQQQREQQETTTMPSYRSTSIEPTDYVIQTSINPSDNPSKSQNHPYNTYSSTLSPNFNSHHFPVNGNIQGEINLDPETPPKLNYHPQSSALPPVSYQKNSYNNNGAVEAHVTVTTHTTIYKDQNRRPSTTSGHRNSGGDDRNHQQRYNVPHRDNPHPFKFRPNHTTFNQDRNRLISTTESVQSNKYNFFKPENDPSDLRYHLFASSTNPPQYLPQRLSLIRSALTTPLPTSTENENHDVYQVQHPHGHSIQEFGSPSTITKRLYEEQVEDDTEDDSLEEAAELIKEESHSDGRKSEDKEPHLQLPLPLIPFNLPSPFTLRDHYETKRSQPTINENPQLTKPSSQNHPHHSLPRVIVSASATISDASGRKLNITLGTISPTLADAIGKAPQSYDDYKETDVSLDPFYHDVPKIQEHITTSTSISSNNKNNKHSKREISQDYFDYYYYVNDNYEPDTYHKSQNGGNNKNNPSIAATTTTTQSIVVPIVQPSSENQTTESSSENVTTHDDVELKKRHLKTVLMLEPVNQAIEEIENVTKSKYVDNKMLILKHNKTTEFIIRLLEEIYPHLITTTAAPTTTTTTSLPPLISNHYLTSIQFEHPKQHEKSVVDDLDYEFVDTSSNNKNIFKCTDHISQLHNFFKDTSDCRVFHYCAPGFQQSQLLHLKFICEPNTYFDEINNICVKQKPSRCFWLGS